MHPDLTAADLDAILSSIGQHVHFLGRTVARMERAGHARTDEKREQLAALTTAERHLCEQYGREPMRPEQRETAREIVARYVADNPDASRRQIAAATGYSPTTVGNVLAEQRPKRKRPRKAKSPTEQARRDLSTYEFYDHVMHGIRPEDAR